MPTTAMKRFSTAMWDFSWATRRTGHEAEYADWSKVLDELAQRGYDNVRIDAFPHLIADDNVGGRRENFFLPAQRSLFMWGNHAPVEISPRKDLICFMQKCKERGISIGLSSWFIADTGMRCQQVRSPDDFVRIWDETLTLIQQAGLIDQILWVDLCNEFPLDLWAPGAASHIFGHAFSSPIGAALRAMPWPQAWKLRTQTYLTAAVGKLKQKWPALKFCYSFHGLAGSSIRQLDTSTFDVAEIHCWLTDHAGWNLASLQIAALLELPGGAALHARRMRGTSQDKLRLLRDEVLSPLMRTWADWAALKQLPLITTEGWGPTNYCDQHARGEEWRWVKDFSELAVEQAINMGWTGICVNNFSQPHHKGMWQDANWHKQITNAIRAGS